MRKLLTLLGVVAVLLLLPTNAKAWGDLYLLNNIWGSWGPTDTNSDYKFTKVNDSEFTYTLDASNHSGDIYWRINTPSDYDGKREIRPDNDGQEVGVSGYNAKYDESYSDKSFKISHSTNNYTHYTITARWDTGGGGFWNVKVEGSGSKVYTSSVYLLGTINSWSGTDYPVVYQGQGGSEWKLSLTKAQVEGALWQGDFYFRFIENMNTGTQYGVYPNVDQTSLTVNGSYNTDTYATTNTTTDDKKDYYWKFTPTGADNYYIYFNHDGDTRSVKVADDLIVAKNVKLRTSADDAWGGKSYDEFDSRTGIYTWYINSLSQFVSGYHEFKLEQGGTWYGYNGTVAAGSESSWTSFSSADNNNARATFTVNSKKYVKLRAKENGSNWDVQVIEENDAPHEYYWVSPQITNGEKWPSFKLVPSRNRYWGGSYVIGDGLISTKYYTFTIKDDDLVTWKTKSKIAANTAIQWYIVRDDDVVVYRPASDLPVNDSPASYDDDHPGTGSHDSYVSYKNYWNGSNYDGATAYKNSSAPYNAGSWSFSKGSAKAHTFNLNVDRGHVLYNYTFAGASDANGYKLAGNWDAGREVSINIGQAKTMDPYYYKNGKVSTSYVAESDSIVYKISVKRPDAGWGGLYLDVLPASNADWDHAIRPLITLGNSLDGRALHGAMTTKSSDQSLNPEASPNYLGYTFSFNATTMTYRLEFHTPDATLSPGTEDGNVDFNSTTSEDITVELSDDSDDIHTTATRYAIGFADNTYFTLDETTKYSAATFNLTYDGENDRITYTSADNSYTNTVAGNTIFVKVRGFDANGDYGDIHTYQYTFHSVIGFEPQGGLFINSAKITITGGTAPYTYQVMNYPTKEENGELVIDFDNGTEITSGSFTSKTDELNRISTPGFLKITDYNGNTVVAAEVGGGFDFTYSTSENYNAATNGADYRRVMPSDLTYKVDFDGWSATGKDGTGIPGQYEEMSSANWTGDATTLYHHLGSAQISQTISGLNPAKDYTVQAIVRGGAVPLTLQLNDNTFSITLTADGPDAKTTINKYGRSEQLVEESTTANMKGWHKIEGVSKPTSTGELTIKISATDADVSDVILLEDANTDGNYWTTAPTSEDVTEYDMSDRSKYNAFSFFDRGANLNSIIKADQKTVIGMSEDNEPYLTGAEKGARRHPCNVVTSSDGGTTWHTPMLALTDYASVIVGSENKYGGNPKVSQHAYGTTFDYTADKFSYDRATSAKMMSTMLPFPLTRSQIESMLGSGVKTYIYGGANKTTYKVTFSETSGELAANTPFFFLPVEAKTSMVLNQSVSVPATPAAAALAEGIVGTYKHTSNVGTYYKNKNFIPYFSQDGSFVWAQDNANAKPFRVVFLLGKGTEARVMNVIFEDDAVTAIDGIAETNIDAAPVYSVDGKLVSSNGDISHLTKGVYVKAGKKFIIK